MNSTAMWLVGGLVGAVAAVFAIVHLSEPSDKKVTPTSEVPLPTKKPKVLPNCPVQPCSDVGATPSEPKEVEPPKVVVTPPSTGKPKPPINDSGLSFDEQIREWREEAR